MMNRTALLVAALVVAAGALDTPVPFKSCGSPSDIVAVKTVDITGTLSPGQTIHIGASGTASKAFAGGSFTLKVTYLGVTVLSTSGDICTNSYFKVTCPVAAGQFVGNGTLDIPQDIPTGAYNVEVKAKSTAGDELLCIQFVLNLGGVDLTRSALDADIIATVNAANAGWTAGENEYFAGRDLAFAKALCGTVRTRKLPGKVPEPIVALPSAFDARTAFPTCANVIGHVRDQSACGSCWAFGATEAFNDRLCIKTNGTFQTLLSVEETTSCCDIFHGCLSMGCDGGDPGDAWNYFVRNGLVSGGDYTDIGKGTTCYPYQLPTCSHHIKSPVPNCSADEYPTPSCPNQQCSEAKYPKQWSDDAHLAASSYSLGDINQVMQDLISYGTVTASFDVYEDFLTYKTGVYSHTTGGYLGGHSIKIFGWGVQGSTPYWWAANSWNQYWGDHGFFKIKRGSDECGIEDGIVAGLA